MSTSKTTIRNLPSKTEFRRDDVIPIEDKGATFNTHVGRLKDYMSKGLADGMVIVNGKLYLTRNGEIIDVNGGVHINVSDNIDYATANDIAALFKE